MHVLDFSINFQALKSRKIESGLKNPGIYMCKIPVHRGFINHPTNSATVNSRPNSTKFGLLTTKESDKEFHYIMMTGHTLMHWTATCYIS